MENERINKILMHPSYNKHIEKIKHYEIDRPFCGHDLSHLLDTARIGYIMNLERHLNLKKDVIYGAALLHDIGRWQQYQGIRKHDIASAELCEEILRDCEYYEDEITKIKTAISNHSTVPKEEDDCLSKLLYEADKKSRSCFECQKEIECDWPNRKKNLVITY